MDTEMSSFYNSSLSSCVLAHYHEVSVELNMHHNLVCYVNTMYIFHRQSCQLRSLAVKSSKTRDVVHSILTPAHHT
jgi:hypothetical protein